MTTNSYRLPPFGQILLAYQQQKVRLDFSIYIHVGKDAKEAAFNDIRSGLIASFVPENEDYITFKWPVAQQYVIVCDQGNVKEEYLHRFCFHLLAYKPRLVYLWTENYRCRFFKGATS